MNKSYIHPTLLRKASPYIGNNNERVLWFIEKYGLDEKMVVLKKDELLALGFQPVEETNNDWIDEAYKEGQRTITKDDIRYFSRDFFRQCIEKHMPKQELIPLDIEKIICGIKSSPSISDTYIRKTLSKYGTTPQNKFSRKHISEYCTCSFVDPNIGEIHIYSFLRDQGLLEE